MRLTSCEDGSMVLGASIGDSTNQAVGDVGNASPSILSKRPRIRSTRCASLWFECAVWVGYRLPTPSPPWGKLMPSARRAGHAKRARHIPKVI